MGLVFLYLYSGCNDNFGYGLHACFGHYINAIQIPQIVASVLKLKKVRPTPSKRIKYDGAFPDQFWLSVGQ